MKKLQLVFALSLMTIIGSTAQSNVEAKNQHYKKRIVRAIDLRESQNKALFSRNSEITKLFLEAMQKGDLKAYANDSLTSVMDYQQVAQKLHFANTVIDFSNDEEIMDGDFFSNQSNASYSYEARDLYQLEITQDWLFDKQHSVLNKENVSITLYVPADHPDNVKGYQFPVATFKFSECQQLWKDNPKAIWFNNQNDAAHINLSDAFKLELYHSYLIKVSNADDASIEDQFPGRASIVESLRQDMRLMEYESNLWEN